MSSITFTASNGIEISKSNPGIVIGDVALHAGEVEALRECFQHERDEELGRWRWPEDRNIVVYYREHGESFVHAYDERTIGTDTVYRGVRAEGMDSYPLTKAGLAYFDAHPEPKPWHDAKPGEVWILDETLPVVVVENDDGAWFQFGDVAGDPSRMRLDHPGIDQARRIWPEPSDG